MSAALARLSAAWFAPAPAARLGLLRVAVGAYGLYYLGRRVRLLERVAASPPEHFAPVGVARPLRRPLPPRVVRGLVLATLATDVAVTLGWRHRVTGPLHAALLLAVLSYRNSWSMVFHTDNTYVLHALVLGLAPAADAVALDARRRPASSGAGELTGDARYGWPIALLNALTAAAYLVSGISKLAGPLGRGWLGGDSLRRQVAVDGVRKAVLTGERAPLATALAPHDALWKAAAWSTMAIEVGAPLALLSRRLGRAWAVAAFGLHWGVLAVMKIRFRYQLSGVAFLPLFDVERLLRGRP